MTKQRLFMALSFSLGAFLVSVWPVAAQGDVEEQIKALEEQVQQLRAQQLEMKKEATAAAQRMPTFNYRKGSGMTITAADKSWSYNTVFRLDINNYNLLGGKPNFDDNGDQRNTGVTDLQLFPRRARWYHLFCWDDCFYEFNHSLDGESASRDASFRDNELKINFSQLNPWLPYYSVGLRRSAGNTYVSRSSSSDGKMEHLAVISAFGFGGAGSHSGMGLGWEEVAIGPGEYEMYLNWAMSQQETWQDFQPSDRSGIMMYIGGKPFAKMKSKWIQGLELGFGYQGYSLDRPENFDPDEAGYRVRLRNDSYRKARQTYWEPGALSSGDSEQNVGRGWGEIFLPGVKWQVGPYFIRYAYGKVNFQNQNDPGMGRGISGRGWEIANQLNLWSPKGFFTGGPRRDNSIVLSAGFERTDVNCGRGCDASPSSGSFHRQSLYSTHVAMWYYINRGLGVGMWWERVTSSNTPYRTQVAIGCKDSRAEALAGEGVSRSCTYNSINTGLRYRW